MEPRLDDPLTEQIIGLAMKVHRTLGPGFLEAVYQRALLLELQTAGIRAEVDKRIRVMYSGVPVGDFIADVLVEDRIILELKAAESLSTAHEVQTVNYLTATGLDVGLLINFGSNRLQFKRKFRRRSADSLDGKPRECEEPTSGDL
jgi:GxxExxY protein